MKTLHSIKQPLTILLLASSVLLANAQNSPIQIDAAAVGLDNTEVSNFRAAMQKAVDAKQIPGVILLISNKDGAGVYESIGVQGPEQPVAMNDKTIFRIYSMTKPIISVATMIQVEKGKLSLSDPVSKYIPEYAELSVIDEKTGKIRPATATMTVQHLMTQQSGLIYGVFAKESALGKRYTEAGIASTAQTMLQMAKKLAGLPLRFDPGSKWHYGRSTDVLGAVLEVATGRSLGQLLKETLFDPLGMVDTAFYLPEDKADRLAEPYHGVLSKPGQRQALQSGGGGLVSTTRDYARFGAMLINQGRFEGVQIIKQETLALMTSPFISEKVSREYFFYRDKGDFGLGFGLVPQNPAAPDSPLTYGWGGYAGTEFWVDPSRGFFVVYMIQAHSVPGGVSFKPRRSLYETLLK